MNDVVRGTDGSDVLEGFADDNLMGGGAGDDTMRGGAGDDKVFGGAGDDVLTGGASNDVLSGGTGNDVLSGGAGRDVFAVGPGSGFDAVVDFQNGMDRIDATALGLDGFEDVFVRTAPNGMGTTVLFDANGDGRADAGEGLRLSGVDASAIEASDFVF